MILLNHNTWYALRDLNPRSPRPKRGALSTKLRAHMGRLTGIEPMTPVPQTSVITTSP